MTIQTACDGRGDDDTCDDFSGDDDDNNNNDEFGGDKGGDDDDSDGDDDYDGDSVIASHDSGKKLLLVFHLACAVSQQEPHVAWLWLMKGKLSRRLSRW